jgi:uncharacterized membrane protein YuzA (DUF378 family)
MEWILILNLNLMMKGECKWTNGIAMVLVLVGALNWGLVGAFDFNLVDTLLGSWATVERVVYILVGVAALWVAGTTCCKSSCKM